MELYFKNVDGTFTLADRRLVRDQHVESSELINIFWNKEDFESCARSNDLVVTEDDIIHAMDIVEEEFDANIGVNWDVILSALQQSINERE